MNFRGIFFFEFDISKKIGAFNHLCQMRCLSDGFAVAIEYGFLPMSFPQKTWVKPSEKSSILMADRMAQWH